MKPTNTVSILDLFALQTKLFNPYNPYSFRARTPAGAKAPHLHRTCGFLGSRTEASARRYMDGGPFQFYLHIQPTKVPLPSFIICKFKVSTYPDSFNLSISHKSKQLISLVNTIPSRICFDTGSSWYIPSFKTIMSIYSEDSLL